MRILCYLYRLGILQKLNFTLSAIIFGKKYVIPIRGGLGVHNLRQDEPWMDVVLQKTTFISEGQFWDIGVNIGQTLLKLKAIDDEREYIGFEPNPQCVGYTTELIRVNALRRAALYPVGLSNKTGVVELNFYSEDSADSSASIIKDFRPQKIYRIEWVPCFKPEEIIGIDQKKIGIVKIDVEGAELEVLLGLETIIKKERPFIIIEVLPIYTPVNVGRLIRQEEIEQLMQGEGYKILRIMKKASNQFNSFQLLEKIGIHADINLSDYLFCPEEHLNAILSS